MQIKRIFNIDDEGKPIDLKTIQVTRLTKTQKITQELINKGITEGFMSMGKGVITFHAEEKDIKFKITAGPGHYCCFDDKKLGGEKEAREYIKENYDGKESPDKQNSSGHRFDDFFQCDLVGEI